MSVFSVIVFLLFSLHLACAAEHHWYEGAIVLKSGEVIAGELAPEPAHDAVLFRAKDGVVVYPAGRVRSFSYYDAEADINRRFLSIYQQVNAFASHRLYEVVLSGDVLLVRHCVSASAVADEAKGYRYYIHAAGKMVNARKFRSAVFPYLKHTSGTIDTYVRTQKLNPRSLAHVIRILDYYTKNLLLVPCFLIGIRSDN